MHDESHMTFGKYGPEKGDHRLMKDIPAKYFLWLWDNVLWNYTESRNQGVKDYVSKNYKALILECPDYIPLHPPMD